MLTDNGNHDDSTILINARVFISKLRTTMAGDVSQDFLHEIDELLSETNGNGDVPTTKQSEDLIESVKSCTVTEKEETPVESTLEATSFAMSSPYVCYSYNQSTYVIMFSNSVQ